MQLFKIHSDYLLIYSLFFILSVIFSILANILFLKFSKNLGMRNYADDGTIIRWGSQSKPALGGISFYILFLLSLESYFIFFANSPSIFINKEFIGFLLASTTAFFMGLADDAYNTKPLIKLFVQILCGCIFILSGTQINFFAYEPLNYFITIFWVVGMMNSINMLDNMDAITTSVAVVICCSAIGIIYMHHDYTNFLLIALIGVAAALSGFLYFNWYPSKMYMGDSGSQFLGVFLAGIGIRLFWNDFPTSNSTSLKQIIITLLIFIMPIVDTTIVIINRLAKKQSPFIGGKDHTTHSLVYLGLKDKQVALLFTSISILSLFFVFLIHHILTWNLYFAGAFIIYFLSVFFVFFYITKLRERKFNH